MAKFIPKENKIDNRIYNETRLKGQWRQNILACIERVARMRYEFTSKEVYSYYDSLPNSEKVGVPDPDNIDELFKTLELDGTLTLIEDKNINMKIWKSNIYKGTPRFNIPMDLIDDRPVKTAVAFRRVASKE